MVEALSYQQIQDILQRIEDKRTQYIIALQYASAARVGEMIEYKHYQKGQDEKPIITHGILRKNIFITPEEISWSMPNFKVKRKDRTTKHPFVLAQEKFLYNIIKDRTLECLTENVIDLKQSHVRKLIREAIKPYSSHILRRSRATHLVDLFDYNAYDIMYALGHTKLDTSMYYVAERDTRRKMKTGLLILNPQEELINEQIRTKE